MRSHTCCIVGNRLLPRGQAEQISARLKEKILKLAGFGVTRFFTGGNLGFDTLAAQTVLRAKEVNPAVRLALVLPSRNQTSKWPEHAVEVYESIKAQADEVIYTSETAARGHMLKRNRYLVDESDYCIAYLIKISGRTAQTVRYAERTGHVVINIADEEKKD